MGPKQRKSLSSSSTSYANSPWKSLTRVELYGVLDNCDISVSSDKLLKGELIEILEKNLDDADCKKWLEYYDKPLPFPEFGQVDVDSSFSETKTISDNQTNIKKGRQSVPAYLAVANHNSDILSLNSVSSKDKSQNSSRRRNSISTYTSEQSNNVSKDEEQIFHEYEKLTSAHKKSLKLPSDIQNDNNFVYKSNSSENIASQKLNLKDNLIKSICSLITETFNFKFSYINFFKLFIFITLITSLIVSYVYFYFFMREPKFCDSTRSIDFNKVEYSSCIKCPANGYCKNGTLICDPQYKKSLKYFGGRWQTVCIYDDEAYDIAEEMLMYISNKLKRLNGHKFCNNISIFRFLKNNNRNYIYNSDNLSMLSESEINDLINLSFNYIDKKLIDNALSIMWNSIKNGNSLSRYKLNIVSKQTFQSENHDSTSRTNDYLREQIFIKALDFEIPNICKIKLFFQKWLIILISIISILLPIYIYYSKNKKKKILIRKIKEIIYRENRKDTNTGLFIGPDATTILKLLYTELPQYRKALSEKLIIKYCDELERKDPNIQKTLLSENKLPFYWVSK